MTAIKHAAAIACLLLASATGARADGAPQEARLTVTVDCKPDYPNAAARAGAQGTTGLAFHVDVTGKVTSVEVVQSAGATREHHLLDVAAAKALARCPLTAALDERGQPVAAVMIAYYTWRLQ